VLALFHNRKLPWDRSAIHQELQHLADQPATEAIPDPSALFTTRLADIHPCSWFAVWWQPLYRIPDMPLDAKLLAYFSFQHVLHDLQRAHAQAQPAAVHMPIAGMLCGAVQAPPPAQADAAQEHWLRVQPCYPRPEAAARAQAQEAHVQRDLRELHTAAQQFTCGCGREMEVYGADGRRMEDEPHNDFAFLQRGRLGASGHA
jgi:Protein of unknown function (DUF789)